MTYFRYANLPLSVKGIVVRDENDDYTIILNPAHSHEQQIRTARHELAHIEHDYDRDIDVDLIERERHA